MFVAKREKHIISHVCPLFRLLFCTERNFVSFIYLVVSKPMVIKCFTEKRKERERKQEDGQDNVVWTQ